jgi:hypothetical protein
MPDLHKIRITIPNGHTVLGKVELDGEELLGVTGFAHGDVDGMTVVTLKIYADLEIEGEAEIVKVWRYARRSWFERLRWRLGI